MNLKPIKPCPFCGGYALLLQVDNHRTTLHLSWHVECSKCRSSTPYIRIAATAHEDHEKNMLIDLWNQRVEVPEGQHSNENLPQQSSAMLSAEIFSRIETQTNNLLRQIVRLQHQLEGLQQARDMVHEVFDIASVENYDGPF